MVSGIHIARWMTDQSLSYGCGGEYPEPTVRANQTPGAVQGKPSSTYTVQQPTTIKPADSTKLENKNVSEAVCVANPRIFFQGPPGLYSEGNIIVSGTEQEGEVSDRGLVTGATLAFGTCGYDVVWTMGDGAIHFVQYDLNGKFKKTDLLREGLHWPADPALARGENGLGLVWTDLKENESGNLIFMATDLDGTRPSEDITIAKIKKGTKADILPVENGYWVAYVGIPEGAGEDEKEGLYVAMLGPDRTLQSQVPLDGYEENGFGPVGSPSMTLNPDEGEVAFAWSYGKVDFQSFPLVIDASLKFATMNIDQEGTLPAILLESLGKNCFMPTLAWSGSGYLLVWNEWISGEAADIYSVIVNRNGEVSQFKTKLNEGDLGRGASARLSGLEATKAGDGVVVAWSEKRDGPEDHEIWDLVTTFVDPAGMATDPVLRLSEETVDQVDGIVLYQSMDPTIVCAAYGCGATYLYRLNDGFDGTAKFIPFLWRR